MKTKEQVGKFLQSLRDNAGMNQEGLAGEIGISRTQLSRIESGKFYPRLEIAVAIIEACGYIVKIEKAAD